MAGCQAGGRVARTEQIYVPKRLLTRAMLKGVQLCLFAEVEV